MNKKTALLHYWLTNMRGGEAVFSEMCKMFPDADVFTHAVIPKKMPQEITSHNITESFIAKLPGGRTHCQKYLPLKDSCSLRHLYLRHTPLLLSL